MLRHRISIAALLLAAVSASESALAGDAALAELLFREGRAQLDAGDYAAACPKLAESYTQDPATGTLLALAMCQEQLGQTASAWANYAEVASRAKRDGRQDREQAAHERLQALEPKLSSLTIQVDAGTAALPDVLVKRDGITVGRGAWGAAAPVDPGSHVVEVTAKGKTPWTARVTVEANGNRQTVQVPALAPEPARAAASERDASPGPENGSKERTSGVPLRTMGLVTGGVGLVTLGVSGFFGLRAKGLYRDSLKDGHCDGADYCDPTGLGARNDAVSASGVATITLIAGGVLTAAGVTLFVVGGPKARGESAARLDVTPVATLHDAAMVVRGRF